MPTSVVSRMLARRTVFSSEMGFKLLEVRQESPAVATFFLLILDWAGSLQRRHSRSVNTRG